MSNFDQLVTEYCKACLEDEAHLRQPEINALLADLPGWQRVEHNKVNMLQKTYSFPDFVTALAFTNRVGAMAEEQGHHPDILTAWGRVELTWYTHKINGLHRNDFRCAARSDQLYT
jgi:4a-hydroxytetrahydrobiopterin dehydratase